MLCHNLKGTNLQKANCFVSKIDCIVTAFRDRPVSCFPKTFYSDCQCKMFQTLWFELVIKPTATEMPWNFVLHWDCNGIISFVYYSNEKLERIVHCLHIGRILNLKKALAPTKECFLFNIIILNFEWSVGGLRVLVSSIYFTVTV